MCHICYEWRNNRYILNSSESLNNWCVFLACCPEEHYVKVIILRRMKHFHIFFLVMSYWIVWMLDVMYFQVHNWTVEQTSEWLATNVELPQYIPNFIQHRVTGATLPRLLVIFNLLKVLWALNAVGFAFEVKTKLGQGKNEHRLPPTCLPSNYVPTACLPHLHQLSLSILAVVLSLPLRSWFIIGVGKVEMCYQSAMEEKAANLDACHLLSFFLCLIVVK